MEFDFPGLKKNVLTMGDKTAEAVGLAVRALVDNDAVAAAEAREIEKQVDAMYLAINELCLGSLAARPCCRDEVNFVTSSLKIAMELERTCDYANQIAKLVQKKFATLNMEPLMTLHGSVASMKDQSLEMLRGALRCYDTLDCALMRQVVDKDNSVDKRNRDLFRDMVCVLSVQPWIQETIMDYHVAIRYIERVADRATNIAELAFYIVEGEPMKKKAAQGGETVG
ncbi:phosphate signaling complex protein PhoU [Anaeroselena agilis]|uniref:Phosphate signaling complex protein PhoU n=1 Tax=Anaeroselena agilis TaxID=3063788 RepID=A0ABU3NXW9_9FIRM|nr:phosphate signaling complex protein PhoU [Selenomonadales bacterium 4137-cl]